MKMKTVKLQKDNKKKLSNMIWDYKPRNGHKNKHEKNGIHDDDHHHHHQMVIT